MFEVIVISLVISGLFIVMDWWSER